MTWSEIPLKLSTTTPDKVLFKYDTSKSGNFRPFVKESKLSQFSTIKHPARDLKDVESRREMIDWFGFGEGLNKKRKDDRERLRQIEKLKKAVISGDKKKVNAVIKRYVNCNDLRVKNRILKEINAEYKLLSKLLQSD